MANLAASAVTINDAWIEVSPSGQRKCRSVTVVLSAQGTTTNTIPVSLFDLTLAQEVTPFIKSTNDIIIVASPSADNTLLLLKAAGTNAPADATGTYSFIVKGK